jgi:hypothetical protein
MLLLLVMVFVLACKFGIACAWQSALIRMQRLTQHPYQQQLYKIHILDRSAGRMTSWRYFPDQDLLPDWFCPPRTH